MTSQEISSQSPTTAPAGPTDLWRRRAWIARLMRLCIFAVPIVLSFVFALFLSTILPSADRVWLQIGRWLLVVVLSTLVLLGLQQVAKRFTPLAGLLSLSLVFPDAAPSRFGIALRTASARHLETRLADVDEHGLGETPEDAARAVVELVALLSKHDRMTRGHSERVRAYSRMIGDELNLDDEALGRLHWAGLLHDIGKIAVPAPILNKPGRLTGEEFELIKQHTVEGHRLVAPLVPWLGEAAGAVWLHHERWEGGGYPTGVPSHETPLAARIVCVADAFDVMTSVRSYKEAMPAGDARAELARCAGTQFDPSVVRAMMSVSLGKLWAAMGPLSLISQLRLFPRRVTQGGAVVATVLAVLLASAISTLALGLPWDTGSAQESHEAAGTPPPAAPAASAPEESERDDPAAAVDSAPSRATIEPSATVLTEPTSSPPATVAQRTAVPSPDVTTTSTAVAAAGPASTARSAPTTAATAPATISTTPAKTTPTTPVTATTTIATTTATTVPVATTTTIATTIPATTIATTTTTTTTTTTLPAVVGLSLGSAAPGDAESSPRLPLHTGSVVNATLPNYDTDRNDDPGLTLRRSEASVRSTDPAAVQTWWTNPPSRNLGDPVRVKIWAAPASAPGSVPVVIEVGLFDCASGGTACIFLGADSESFIGAAGDFAALIFDISPVPSPHRVRPGRELQVRVAVPAASSTDVWLAYDAAEAPAAISLF